MPAARSFEATLERTQSRLNWVIIRIPFDVGKIWGTRGQLRIKGEINGFGFRSSLFPTGEGGHILLVNKRMQAAANVHPGKAARFRLEPDTEERTAAIPPELTRFLSEDRALRRWFDQLNYSRRKEIANWITDVKSTEARERRANQIAERLLATKEAEQELPPVLRLAFARNPRAREGWEQMPPSHRRNHLFAVFYYRTPEAQARRVAQLVQDAYKYAEKGSAG
jgi:uncharacterized protein YdeI (YjbR/CyaY-like superfamily)